MQVIIMKTFNIAKVNFELTFISMIINFKFKEKIIL